MSATSYNHFIFPLFFRRNVYVFVMHNFKILFVFNNKRRNFFKYFFVTYN